MNIIKMLLTLYPDEVEDEEEEREDLSSSSFSKDGTMP